MQFIALFAGLLTAGANYALLHKGIQALRSRRTAPLWMLSGLLLPVLGLALCAALSPQLLLFYGCAAGGALPLIAIAHMTLHIIKQR